MKKTALLLVGSLLFCLTPVRAVDSGGLSQSGQVVAAALSQMGYTEGEEESTVFGQCYGYPNGFWCDMFVSWCAGEAQVPEAVFPRSASCGEHCRQFTAMGRYQKSAARGGSYIPRQGDLALFRSLKSGIINHVGLVLYVENEQVFTVEGNALTNRLDYPAEEVSAARRSSLEPNDYVTVNVYPLYSPKIHGYAVPDYASREPLSLEGFVDLGSYESHRAEISAVAAAGVMAGTSSHTFSPRAGMTRGAFLEAVLDLCAPPGWGKPAPGIAGVSPEGRYDRAAAAARSAGFLPDGETFDPERWISGEDAQSILSAALAYLGREDRSFSFTPGDLSEILTPYTTRGDLALALYAVWREAPAVATKPYDGAILMKGTALDWPARTWEGECYVALAPVLERFSGISSPDFLRAGEGISAAEEDGRGVRRCVTLKTAGKTRQVQGFFWNGALYVPLEEVARLLPVRLKATL